jgi:hypothetical protein
VWPTEPAKAGWSFNKWQKTRILKELPRHHLSNLLRNGQGPAAARAVVAAPADVADAAVVAEAGQVLVAGVALRVDRVVVAAAHVVRVRAARAVVDAVSAKVVTAMGDGATVEASSSRT